MMWKVTVEATHTAEVHSCLLAAHVRNQAPVTKAAEALTQLKCCLIGTVEKHCPT